jgi:negative regulator of replication initiation
MFILSTMFIYADMDNIAMTEWKLIRVTEDLHKRLAKEGQYGDSMGDIIERLLNNNPKVDQQASTVDQQKSKPRIRK